MDAREFAGILARSLKELDALTAKDPKFLEQTKQRILQSFISRSLTLDFARAHNLVLEEKTLDQAVDKIRASYPDDLSFRRELALQNQSFSEWRNQIRYRLIEELVFAKINEGAKSISDVELKQYYEQRKDFFKRKPRIYVRQIVLDDEAKAEFLLGELKKKSFEDLAKRYSIAPEGKQGGAVGWIEKGTLDYLEPLFAKPLNQIFGPIKSPFGFHLVRIEKKSSNPTLLFEEVRSLLQSELQAKREQANFIAWLDSQVRASRVLKNVELINAIKVETRGEE